MGCSHIDGCELYPLFSQRSLLEVWKTNYCYGDFARCARYQLSCGGETVPQTLLPNGKHLAIDGTRK